MYYKGQDTKKYYTKAKEWTEKTVMQGYRTA